MVTFFWKSAKKGVPIFSVSFLAAMPFPVKVFSVKIASPPEADMETVIARQVIDEWNADYARAEGMVFLPEVVLDSEKSADTADVLLAFFSGLGAPNHPAATEISGLIERYLQARLPVFIYFSEARTGFMQASPERVEVLGAFKAGYAGAMIDSFRDEKELRSKFAQQLAAEVRTHPHFRTSPATSAEKTSLPMPAQSGLGISETARLLLTEAAEDPEAYVGIHRDGYELKLQVNVKQLVEPGSAERWTTAFQELLTLGLIREAGCHGRLFQITPVGFEFLESMAKSLPDLQGGLGAGGF